jgi:mannose-6-phosphate isomerase-like protein (cupin superfamily)
MVWECTAGRFNWHYSEDETVVVISGEVFITAEKGDETRLGQGDVGFFPAGSSCIWRINDRVKKVAVLRKDMPIALGFGVRVWNKALRIAGLRGQSSLMPAAGNRSEPNAI